MTRTVPRHLMNEQAGFTERMTDLKRRYAALQDHLGNCITPLEPLVVGQHRSTHVLFPTIFCQCSGVPLRLSCGRCGRWAVEEYLPVH